MNPTSKAEKLLHFQCACASTSTPLYALSERPADDELDFEEAPSGCYAVMRFLKPLMSFVIGSDRPVKAPRVRRPAEQYPLESTDSELEMNRAFFFSNPEWISVEICHNIKESAARTRIVKARGSESDSMRKSRRSCIRLEENQRTRIRNWDELNLSEWQR